MSDIIREVNQDFRETLTRIDTPEHPAIEIVKEVNNEFHKRGAVINTPEGNKPFPIFIKPYFITRQRMEYVRRVSNVIMDVLEKVSNLYFVDDKYKPMFNLTDKETELVKVEPGTKRNVWITRNDAFMTEDWLKFIEFNTDSPGGPMYSDVQTMLIEQTTVMDELRKKYYFSSDRFVPVILYNLLQAYREWGGKKEHPNIAIVSDKGVTYPEFLMIVEDFRRKGYNCEFSTPEEIEYDGKKAYANKMPIDVFYRRGWIRNWTDVYDEIKPLRRAYADGAICVVNSIRSILAAIKSLIEVIQDPEIMKMYTEEEKDTIRKHVPWTKLMVEKKTYDPEGNTVDLYDYVRKNRETLVLKPMDLYGGKMVCVGPAVDQAEWEKTIENTTGDQKFVVQEYVPIPEDELPVIGQEGVEWQAKKMNQNFYAFGGHHAGGMIRTSEAAVINISAGGGLTPIVIVEGRKS